MTLFFFFFLESWICCILGESWCGGMALAHPRDIGLKRSSYGTPSMAVHLP